MKRFIILAAVMLSPVAASADDGREWHLLQRQADGGVASVIRGLTKAECEFAKNRIEGNPATPADQQKAEDMKNAQMQRASEWMKAHPDCDGMTSVIGASGASGGEFEDQGKGKCYWFLQRGDVSGSYSPHDVMAAECFQ